MRFAFILLGLFVLAGCAQTSETSPPPEGPYTMEDVAQRDSQESCWTVIDGDVYDLTEWISQHPGGARAIVELCGADGTDAFEGQHATNENALSTLARYRIGALE